MGDCHQNIQKEIHSSHGNLSYSKNFLEPVEYMLIHKFQTWDLVELRICEK